MIGWLIFAAYLLAAVFYARSCLRRWSRDPHSLFAGSDADSGDRASAALGAVALGLIWPVALSFYSLTKWLWKPVDRDRERIERLQQDRHAWWLRTNSLDPKEQRMASDIVATLDDILRRES